MNTVNKRKFKLTITRGRKLSQLAQANARIRELEMDSYASGEQIKILRSKLERVEWVIPLIGEIELALRRLRGG